MQRNRALLREIENTNQPSFIPTNLLRAHKGIAQQYKFKATSQNATDIDSAKNSLREILYNLTVIIEIILFKKYLYELLNTFLDQESA